MVKAYTDLTEQEESQISDAWLLIYKGLEVYERIFDVDLSDLMHGELWENIEYLQSEANNE